METKGKNLNYYEAYSDLHEAHFHLAGFSFGRENGSSYAPEIQEYSFFQMRGKLHWFFLMMLIFI